MPATTLEPTLEKSCQRAGQSGRVAPVGNCLRLEGYRRQRDFRVRSPRRPLAAKDQCYRKEKKALGLHWIRCRLQQFLSVWFGIFGYALKLTLNADRYGTAARSAIGCRSICSSARVNGFGPSNGTTLQAEGQIWAASLAAFSAV